MNWLFEPLQSIIGWLTSTINSLLDLLRSLPSLVQVISNWNFFVPSFVLAFFSIGLALGVVLFILKRK